MIGREAREQFLAAEGRLPEVVVACVGGGSNAIGIFAGFLDDDGRAARRRRGRGRGVASAPAAPACCTARARRCSRTRTARSSTRTRSRPGSTTRASAPSTRSCATPAAPSTSARPTTRRSPRSARLTRTEGIIPALEPAHALARARELDEELRARLPQRPRRQGSRRGAGAWRRMTRSRRHFHVTIGSHEPVLRFASGDTVVTWSSTSVRLRRGTASGSHRRRQSADRARSSSRARRRATRSPSLDSDRGRIARVAVRGQVVAPNVVDPEFVPELPAGATERRLVEPRPRARHRDARDAAAGPRVAASCRSTRCSAASASRRRAARRSRRATSGPHGGNMDYRGFRAGRHRATSRSSSPGALFHVGDGARAPGRRRDRRHGHRGLDGRRVHGRARQGQATIVWPRAENDEFVMAVGNARPLDQAVQHATTELMRMLAERLRARLPRELARCSASASATTSATSTTRRTRWSRWSPRDCCREPRRSRTPRSSRRTRTRRSCASTSFSSALPVGGRHRRDRAGVPRSRDRRRGRACRRGTRRCCAWCMREQLPEMIERGLLSPYVIDDTRTGEPLGGLTLHHFDPMRDAVEVGYWLFLTARGRGVATRSVQAAVEHAFANGILRVEAHVRVGNVASERVLERARLRARRREAALPPPRGQAPRRDALRAGRRRLGVPRTAARRPRPVAATRQRVTNRTRSLRGHDPRCAASRVSNRPGV